MKKQKSIFIAISLLLHLAMLTFAFETTENKSSKIVPPSESDVPRVNENEKKAETTETGRSEWHSKSVKISMHRETLPSVVIESEFITSLRAEVLLLVIVSAGFHTLALQKL